ncbi:MAG: TIGR04282 family arsenosugar biosynthesis glycosyltransferase [Terriglobia bacterium]
MIFARHPQRGRVKTRLVPPLTAEEALGLHGACLQSTARLAASLPASIGKLLYLSSASLPGARRVARTLTLPRALRVRLQRGRNLGARLRRAFAELRAEGYDRIVFIGSDSPLLTRKRLHEALAALRRADAVIGPARDGGYYLLGARGRAGGLERILCGIDWGTERAYQQTRARLRKEHWRTVVLPRGYDVDTARDLNRLRRDVRRSRQAHLAPLRDWFGQSPGGARGNLRRR